MFLVQGILKWGRNIDLGQGTLTEREKFSTVGLLA